MAEKKAKKVETLYQVHNMVRKVETRLRRAKAASRHRLNLLIGGGLLRIPRGRNVPVTESLLQQLLPELQRMENAGKVKVTTMTGERIDLHTLKPSAAAPAPKAALPKPPMDSVAADKTFEHGVGQNMPTVAGGKAVNQEVARPAVLDDAVPEGEEEVADEVEETDEESPDETSSSTGGKAPKRGKRRGR